MFKEKAKELKGLRKFGEMCVATAKAMIQGKLSDSGTVCVFVGYPNKHAKDVYRILNLKANCIMKSRDVIWSRKSYGWIKLKDCLERTDDDLYDSKFEGNGSKEEKESELSTKGNKTPNNKKVLKEISKLKRWFDPSRFMEAQDSGRDLVVESADIALHTLDLVEERKAFDEAYNHPNVNQNIKWQDAISKGI